MVKMPADYVERVYAGWLGKAIGVRYGAPVEMWSSERIAECFGPLNGYVKHYADFAADDDTNGPLFFIRALEDYTPSEALSAEQIGKTYLNYTPFEHGFFWWGGYGVSAEHTVYTNLRHGIAAPRSGSMAQNGHIIPEQIGGQIFIDAWGLVSPVDTQKAARYAEKAASVAFDRNGVYGGQFIAACISAAFALRDAKRIIEQALTVIPAESDYARMARDVIAFHADHPDDWRACLRFIERHYWSDRYIGSCHIIPNAAIIVLSLLYGVNDFTKTLNICNMCGFDTDCNVGNVGTIMGVMVGLDGIDHAKWRAEINDFLACSSVVGCLNITDLASSALYIAKLGYRVAGEALPSRWREAMTAGGYHFELPGSTQSMRAALSSGRDIALRMENTDECAHGGSRCLKICASPIVAGESLKIFLKTYYEKEDFSDGRYEPTFSPIAYPGQTVTAFVRPMPGCALRASLYALNAHDRDVLRPDPVALAADAWTKLQFTIPPGTDACIREVGLWVESGDWAQDDVPFGLYLDDLSWRGAADYRIDFAKEHNWTWDKKITQTEVSQFTRLKGIWHIESGWLSGYCSDFAEVYTGDIAWADYQLTARLIPESGGWHAMLFRVQGAMRAYAVCLREGKLQLLKHIDGRYEVLCEAPHHWRTGREYRVDVALAGNRIAVSGLPVYEDAHAPYLHGMIGCAVRDGSHCRFGMLSVQPLARDHKEG